MLNGRQSGVSIWRSVAHPSTSLSGGRKAAPKHSGASMSEPLLIPCPHCNGLNRLPAARLNDAPKCGRCKQDVLLSKPFDLSESSYVSQIKGDLPLLLDVWADWCGPCKSFAPIFEQAASQLPPGQTRQRGQSQPGRATGHPLDSQPDPVQEWPRNQPPSGRLATPVIAGVVA